VELEQGLLRSAKFDGTEGKRDHVGCFGKNKKIVPFRSKYKKKH
jgi:hypothetical protein